MDLLTHLFLPLTVAYVLRRDLFENPATMSLAGFGLFSDFDKFLGRPGLLHSALTVVPVCLAILALEYFYRGGWRYAPLVSGFVASHLILDIVDGGPVPLFYPLVDRGIGLQYPARTVFGEGPTGVQVRGHIIDPRMVAPKQGFNTYTFIDAEGVAWLLAFAVIFVGLEWEDWSESRPVNNE